MDVFVNENVEEPTRDRVALRADLIAEEVKETLEALTGHEVDFVIQNHVGRFKKGDMPEIADGIVDSIYVLLGTAIEYGIDIEPIWGAVQKANMAKVGGGIREDGKRLKPEGWEPPPIADLIEAQVIWGKPLAECGEPE